MIALHRFRLWRCVEEGFVLLSFVHSDRTSCSSSAKLMIFKGSEACAFQQSSSRVAALAFPAEYAGVESAVRLETSSVLGLLPPIGLLKDARCLDRLNGSYTQGHKLSP
jgi:hypothetical protein